MRNFQDALVIIRAGCVLGHVENLACVRGMNAWMTAMIPELF